MDILLEVLLVWVPRIFVVRFFYFAVKQRSGRRMAFWFVGILWPVPMILAYWVRRWHLKWRATHPRQSRTIHPHVSMRKHGSKVVRAVGYAFVFVLSLILDKQERRRRWHG